MKDTDPYTAGYLQGLEATKPLVRRLQQELTDERQTTSGLMDAIAQLTRRMEQGNA